MAKRTRTQKTKSLPRLMDGLKKTFGKASQAGFIEAINIFYDMLFR